MQVGIFGLSRSGKTTLFRALTGETSGGGDEVNIAVVEVPDERFTRLLPVFSPKKNVPATVQVLDFAGVAVGEGKGISAQMLARAGAAEALCAVLRDFDDGSGLSPDPVGDLENLLLEVTLSDLQKVENRLERLRKMVLKLAGAERKTAEAELVVLERLQPALEAGKPIRSLGITPEEEPLIRGFQFLSQKALLVVLNTGEGMDAAEQERALAAVLPGEATDLITVNAEIEMEIAQLDTPEERRAFMEDFGLAEPARDRLIQRLFALLGLITFYTVSEKEVHAWTVPAGSSAPTAAGTIHSDMERGFIRAEVIAVDEFFACGATLADARNVGKLRTEGKGYTVQDGDIFHVLFSV